MVCAIKPITINSNMSLVTKSMLAISGMRDGIRTCSAAYGIVTIMDCINASTTVTINVANTTVAA